MKKLILLSLFGCFLQINFAQTNLDSLKQVIETADHDSVVIKVWVAWDEIIYQSDRKLSLELNQKIAQRCEKRLEASNQPANPKEKM